MTISINQEATPLVWNWLQNAAATFEFAASLRNYANKHGYLTTGQYAAALRCAERDAKPKAAPAGVEVEALDKLHNFFDKAKKTKLKATKLHFEGFTAKEASAKGKNPGAIYLTTEQSKRKDGPCVWGSGSNFTSTAVYLGKLQTGKFFRARECNDEMAANIVKTLINPLEAAMAYGKRTGRCTVCYRKLTDPVSIANGIGPICAEGFNP